MRLAVALGVLLFTAAFTVVAQSPSASRYLVTWAGDADATDSDFLAVVDVLPGSKTFGQVIDTVPVGATGTIPHHTKHFFVPGHPLFANGYAVK